MRKIVLITYYELKEHFLYIEELFREKYKWDVTYYPLYMYSYDKNSKIDNVDTHMSEFFSKESPDVVLWWFIDVKVTIFNRIIKENPETYFIMYNFDDPNNLTQSLFKKTKLFDAVITTCSGSKNMYSIHSDVKDIKYHPIGYDPNIFRKYEHEEIEELKIDCDLYTCDLCTFMSNYNDSTHRFLKKLIKYCLKYNRKLNIYAPEYVIGEINIDDIINELKVNTININQINLMVKPNYMEFGAILNLAKALILYHPKKVLLGEEMSLVAASNKIIVDDRSFTKEYYDRLNNQLNNQLNDQYSVSYYNKDYSNFRHVIEDSINSVNNEFVNKARYSWDTFVTLIYRLYVRRKFDYEFYVNTYKLSNLNNKNDAYKYYNRKFKSGEIHIPYRFKVPTSFNVAGYAEKMGFELDYDEQDDEQSVQTVKSIDSNGKSNHSNHSKSNHSKSNHSRTIASVSASIVTNITINNVNNIDIVENKTGYVTEEYCYIHWYMNGKSSDFIKRGGNVQNTGLAGSEMLMPTSKIFDLYRAFNMINIYRDIDGGIDEIERIAKGNPGIKINSALEKYIDTIVIE